MYIWGTYIYVHNICAMCTKYVFDMSIYHFNSYLNMQLNNCYLLNSIPV